MILMFLNMTRTFDFSLDFLSDIGAATLGMDAFFSLLIISFVYLGYRTTTNIQGQTNIVTIPIFTILACIMFSFFMPTILSYLLWFIAFFLVAGSVAWKLLIKNRGEK